MSWSSFFHNTGVGHIRTEALQQRIRRHADEELHARCLQPINKPSNFNHLSPSFQMRGTLLIAICEEGHAEHPISSQHVPFSAHVSGETVRLHTTQQLRPYSTPLIRKTVFLQSRTWFIWYRVFYYTIRKHIFDSQFELARKRMLPNVHCKFRTAQFAIG